MTFRSRREFLRHSSLGLAGLGATGLLLPAWAQPTEPSGELGAYGQFLALQGDAPLPAAPDNLRATEENILGPYYRAGAPFRAKITPPLEPGTVLLIQGRVWGLDSRKPLAGAVVDIWQANAQGRYDNDDPKNPPAADSFTYRARMLTDEQGRYEYETVHPGRYKTGPNTWRPSHVHYLVKHPGYKTLVTQMYFKGDPMNKSDDFIRESLIIDTRTQRAGNSSYEVGRFDIVLAPAGRA